MAADDLHSKLSSTGLEIMIETLNSTNIKTIGQFCRLKRKHFQQESPDCVFALPADQCDEALQLIDELKSKLSKKRSRDESDEEFDTLDTCTAKKRKIDPIEANRTAIIITMPKSKEDAIKEGAIVEIEDYMYPRKATMSVNEFLEYVDLAYQSEVWEIAKDRFIAWFHRVMSTRTIAIPVQSVATKEEMGQNEDFCGVWCYMGIGKIEIKIPKNRWVVDVSELEESQLDDHHVAEFNELKSDVTALKHVVKTQAAKIKSLELAQTRVIEIISAEELPVALSTSSLRRCNYFCSEIIDMEKPELTELGAQIVDDAIDRWDGKTKEIPGFGILSRTQMQDYDENFIAMENPPTYYDKDRNISVSFLETLRFNKLIPNKFGNLSEWQFNRGAYLHATKKNGVYPYRSFFDGVTKEICIGRYRPVSFSFVSTSISVGQFKNNRRSQISGRAALWTMCFDDGLIVMRRKSTLKSKKWVVGTRLQCPDEQTYTTHPIWSLSAKSTCFYSNC